MLTSLLTPAPLNSAMQAYRAATHGVVARTHATVREGAQKEGTEAVGPAQWGTWWPWNGGARSRWLVCIAGAAGPPKSSDSACQEPIFLTENATDTAVRRFSSSSGPKWPVLHRFFAQVGGELSYRPYKVCCGQVAQGGWLEETWTLLFLHPGVAPTPPTPIKGPPDPLQETHLRTKASFFHTHIVSIVPLGDSHLVVIEKIGREDRRELRRSQICQILFDFVPLQIWLIFE